jgi:hypothetical protein
MTEVDSRETAARTSTGFPLTTLSDTVSTISATPVTAITTRASSTTPVTISRWLLIFVFVFSL